MSPSSLTPNGECDVLRCTFAANNRTAVETKMRRGSAASRECWRGVRERRARASIFASVSPLRLAAKPWQTILTKHSRTQPHTHARGLRDNRGPSQEQQRPTDSPCTATRPWASPLAWIVNVLGAALGEVRLGGVRCRSARCGAASAYRCGAMRCGDAVRCGAARCGAARCRAAARPVARFGLAYRRAISSCRFEGLR